MEKIADAAEVSVGAVYFYFKNKEDLLIQTLEEVPIHVQRGRDGGMPQSLLDHLRVLTLGDQHRSMGMPQVMKPQWFAHRGAHSR